MTPFTDDDLQKFRQKGHMTMSHDKRHALIARLEAAEALILAEFFCREEYCPDCEAYRSWRKAAGKK